MTLENCQVKKFPFLVTPKNFPHYLLQYECKYCKWKWEFSLQKKDPKCPVCLHGYRLEDIICYDCGGRALFSILHNAPEEQPLCYSCLKCYQTYETQLDSCIEETLTNFPLELCKITEQFLRGKAILKIFVYANSDNLFVDYDAKNIKLRKKPLSKKFAFLVTPKYFPHYLLQFECRYCQWNWKFSLHDQLYPKCPECVLAWRREEIICYDCGGQAFLFH